MEHTRSHSKVTKGNSKLMSAEGSMAAHLFNSLPGNELENLGAPSLRGGMEVGEWKRRSAHVALNPHL